MRGIIFDIKEMAVHDGPGIRTTVFLKGCPLRCIWCHNPEGLHPYVQMMYKEARCVKCNACRVKCDHEMCRPFGRCMLVCPENCMELSGRWVQSEELAAELRENADILGKSFGGVTFSGGEPLMQADFLLEVREQLSDISAAIETSGYADPDVFEKVIGRMDFVYMDLKLADDELHRKFTGVSNKRILENLEILKNSGIPCAVRTPLIPHITDTEENLNAIEKLTEGITWEKLPCNKLAAAKYTMLEMDFPYDAWLKEQK